MVPKRYAKVCGKLTCYLNGSRGGGKCANKLKVQRLEGSPEATLMVDILKAIRNFKTKIGNVRN